MIAKCPYRCNPRLYEDYYLHQTGHGLPVFIGGKGLHGHGLGSVLGGLFRAAMPLIKQGGKALLREGSRAGAQMIGDVLSGQNLKTAAKNRARQVGQNMLTQAVNRISAPTPTKRIKLSSQSRGTQKKSTGKRKRTRRTNKTTRKSDIFS